MTPSSPTPVAAGPPAERGAVITDEVLRVLGLDRRIPAVVALVLVCERYGFDPLLGHVEIIKTSGGPTWYVTRDGYLDVAHRSGVLDGIETDVWEGEHGWGAVATVYRKDMSHPFVYKGGCGKAEPQGRQGHGPEMAVARAERRALKRAFNIVVPDQYDEPAAGAAVYGPPGPAPVSVSAADPAPDTAPQVDERPPDRPQRSRGGESGVGDHADPSEPAMAGPVVPAPAEGLARNPDVGLMIRLRRGVDTVWPTLLEPDKERLSAALVAVATHTRDAGPTSAAFRLDTAETLALSRLLNELEAGRATAEDDPELDVVSVHWDTWHYRVTFAPELAVMVTKDYDPDDPERPM
jgi:hypothetical protein